MKDPFKVPNPRGFPKKMKEEALERQNYQCDKCGKKINLKTSEGHHAFPNSMGGPTHSWNLQMLCIPCHKIITKEHRGVFF